VGTLAEIRGTVEIINPGEKDFRTAKLYEDILEKDRIRTGPAARAKILYDDDSLTVLGENSAIEVREYDLAGDKKRNNSVIGLLQGKLRFIVTKYFAKDKSNFSVQTPTAVMGVRGSDSVAILDGDCTKGFQLFGNSQFVCAGGGGRMIELPGGFGAKGCAGVCEGPFPINMEQMDELLGFFAKMTAPKDELSGFDSQDKKGDILQPPQLFPGTFVAKPPHEGGSGGGSFLLKGKGKGKGASKPGIKGGPKVEPKPGTKPGTKKGVPTE